MSQLRNTKCIIMPGNVKKRNWNLMIAGFLIYTAVFVPLRVAFFDDIGTALLILETIIDIVFIIDIFLSFFTAIEKHNAVEVRHKKIALIYLAGWFWIDLVAAVPFQLLEKTWESSDTSDLKLARVTRIPRLYRIIRVLRLLKLFRLTKKRSATGFNIIQRLFAMTSAVSNMLWLCIILLFITHLVACLWYLQAKYTDFEDDCWVIKEGMYGQDVLSLYIVSFYWAL